MSKYYKDKTGCQIIKFISNTDDLECFKGIVLTGDKGSKVGEICDSWLRECFEPYTPTPEELAEWGETETPPKYYKHIDTDMVVKVEKENGNTFSGTVEVAGGKYIAGAYLNAWYKPSFEPYELNTETLSSDNPNKVKVSDKDINLRLECLKLAIELNKSNVGLDMAYCLEEAIESYNWIKTNQ